MHAEPATTKPPIEAKVKAMTLGSYLAGVAGLAVLQAINDDLTLIEFLPDWLETILIPLLPTGIAAVAGWKAQHTPRPDLPADQR